MIWPSERRRRDGDTHRLTRLWLDATRTVACRQSAASASRTRGRACGGARPAPRKSERCGLLTLSRRALLAKSIDACQRVVLCGTLLTSCQIASRVSSQFHQRDVMRLATALLRPAALRPQLAVAHRCRCLSDAVSTKKSSDSGGEVTVEPLKNERGEVPEHPHCSPFDPPLLQSPNLAFSSGLRMHFVGSAARQELGHVRRAAGGHQGGGAGCLS